MNTKKDLITAVVLASWSDAKQLRVTRSLHDDNLLPSVTTSFDSQSKSTSLVTLPCSTAVETVTQTKTCDQTVMGNIITPHWSNGPIDKQYVDRYR